MASKEISLTKGFVTIVDEEDYERLIKWKWHYKDTGYAVRKPWDATLKKSAKAILMHRIIIDAPQGMDVDHINGNPLDNRRCNLRVCHHAENIQSQRIRVKNNPYSSKYKGVYWLKKNKKWCSRITANKKVFYLGIFYNEKDAAKTYNNAAIKHHGEFAVLNFIDNL